MTFSDALLKEWAAKLNCGFPQVAEVFVDISSLSNVPHTTLRPKIPIKLVSVSQKGPKILFLYLAFVSLHARYEALNNKLTSIILYKNSFVFITNLMLSLKR